MKRAAVIRWILAVAVLPFAVLGLLVLAARLYGLVRYDSAYFAEPYLQRYRAPEAAVRALERALQTDDAALLTELQGVRWPGRFPTGPDIDFVMLWGRTDRYTLYLYFDRGTYERYLIPFEFVRGRWVVVPQDLYYLVHSGRVHRMFLPVAVAWWAVGLGALGAALLSCRSAR